MNVSLGKRKRSQAKHPVASKASEELDEAENLQSLQDIFRKHFEAQFKPLPVQERKTSEGEIDDLRSSDESDADEYGDDAWEGFSEDDKPVVEVVEHTDIAIRRETAEGMDKKELRAFLSSKVPIMSFAPNTPLVLKPTAEDDEDEKTNLKNDLALQRLLSESHLLSKDSSNGLNPTGKSRHKALDLRFQALGSKDSVFAQEKMPMNIRKGMVKKKTEREQKRRKDAKDSGVILEREIKGKQAVRKRERGVGAPAVGNFKKGLLTLSRKDLVDIQSTRSHGPRGKR